MSILNIIVTPTKVCLVVDTMASADAWNREAHDCPPELSKLLPVVHLNAVLAMRGHTGFLGLLGLECRHIQSVDDLLEVIPKKLRATSFPDGEGAYMGEYMGESILAVGWSTKARGMVARRYNLTERHADADAGLEIKDIESWSLAPAPEPVPNRVETLDDLVSIARGQSRWLCSRDNAAPALGRLVLAEVTRDSLRISYAEL